MKNNPKNIKDVDIIFLSGCDHYGKTDNHGLYQMFKFFKNNIDKRCIYLNTSNSMFSNNIDCFNISDAFSYVTLEQCLNRKVMDPNLSNHPIRFFSEDQNELYINMVSNTLIKHLPSHKLLILGDKFDLDQIFLHHIMKHFSSKVLYVSMVNNLWTGFCSYPADYNCNKFEKNSFCDNSCPALLARNQRIEFSYDIFEQSEKFFNKNKESVFINIGNSYVLEEANSSHLCSDIEKVIIPLKTVPLQCETHEELLKFKNSSREEYNASISKSSTLFMWSCYNISNERKGFDFFVKSIQKLKEISTAGQFDNIFIFISCLTNNEKIEKLKQTGVKFKTTGLLGRKEYTKILASCDAYCSTSTSDAGPRTTYESAAVGTPIISFDKCNAVDFVNEENGALVETCNTDKFAEAMLKIILLNEEEKKNYSNNIFNSYKNLMDDDILAEKWNNFLNKIME